MKGTKIAEVMERGATPEMPTNSLGKVCKQTKVLGGEIVSIPPFRTEAQPLPSNSSQSRMLSFYYTYV
jgi:hypothetical protein